MKSFKNIGVIGAGSMGVGIAQIASTSDCNVFLYDKNKSVSEQAIKKLEKVFFFKLTKTSKVELIGPWHPGCSQCNYHSPTPRIASNRQ